MKYFAELSPSNTVIKLALGDDSETEASIKAIEKSDNVWKETSKALTGQRAGIDYTYDPANNIFYAPQPYPSWTLNTTNGQWEPPVAEPAQTGLELWEWDEAAQEWANIGYQE